MKMRFMLALFVGTVLFLGWVKDSEELQEVVDDSIAVSIESLGNEQYKLVADNYSLVVDGLNGGKISSLMLGSHEFLTGSDIHATNWGATFWASPQSLWGWPPPSAFDKDSYTMTIEGDKLVATGQVDTKKTNLQFIKTVSFNQNDKAIELNFEIVNHNTTAYSVAPWLITRVPAKGLAFFPVDTATAQTSVKFEIKKGADVVWFDFSPDTLKEVKFINNSNEGWIAHYADNYLFVQKFDDVAADKIAPKEGDAEVYIAPGKSYVELEPQGEYQSIPSGGSIYWKVILIMKEVESTVNTECGSQSLFDLVRGYRDI